MASRLVDLLRSPVVRRILIVVALIVAYQVWIAIQTVGKVDADVGQDPEPDGRFAVDVELGFAPERFHILKLQEHGRVAGSDEEVVHLRGVSPAGVDALARMYWIEEITPGEGGSGGLIS